MQRLLLPALAALALFAATTRAEAQMTVQLTEVVGREQTILLTQPINLEECQRGAVTKFLLNNVPATASVIDIWRGEGCNATEPRTNTTNESCVWLTSVNSENRTMFYIENLTASQLLPCTSGSRQTSKLWFLAATMAQSIETITSYSQVQLTADADPPEPPTNVTTGDGSTSIPVSWTKPADNDLNNYWVLISSIDDPSDTTCATSQLIAGEPMPAGVAIAATPAGGAQSATVNPSDFGVPDDGYAAVAVVARDTALNVSVVSEVACLRRLPTSGFWSRYVAEGGTAATCSVSAPGADTDAAAGLGWMAFFAVAFGLVRARARRARTLLPIVALTAASWASGASAQDASSDTVITRPTHVGSPERFTIEFRGGGFSPRVGNSSFRAVFGDNAIGPLLSLEVDALVYRIPYVGPIYVGTGIGTAKYTANAFSTDGRSRVTEETNLSLIPISALAILRVDVLAREFGLPFILTGKFGADFTYWQAWTGAQDDAKGLSIGLRWGAQLGFELDFFDRSAARALDEMWGLNHAFVFGELLGVIGVGSPLITNAVGWAAGLGFNF